MDRMCGPLHLAEEGCVSTMYELLDLIWGGCDYNVWTIRSCRGDGMDRKGGPYYLA